MTPDEDRLCVAATLTRRLASIASVRKAIEEQTLRGDSTPVSDLLVELGILSTAERDAFQRLLLQRLEGEPDREQALQRLLRRQVDMALELVEDPTVCAFLGQRPSAQDVEMRSSTTYHLVRIENEGGLGQIWLATEESTCRQVAIKRIKPEAREAKDVRRRFFKEAQIIGRLQHPNIVPVYQLGTTFGAEEPYYSMPFVEGRTLEEVVAESLDYRKSRPLDPEPLNRLLNIFLKICDAVGYANSCGIIHRDLKPQNIMVGQFGEVFVLDWGLAKDTKAEPALEPVARVENEDQFATQCGAVLGSPLYMAPEQAAGRTDEIDARSDVYGLGGILHKILSGREPNALNPKMSLRENLAQIAQHPVRSMRELGDGVPPALAAICHKALAGRREDRYATAGELAKDIERWLVGNPVSVYREPALQSVARWALRHRRIASFGAALVGLLVIAASATLASTWAYANAAVDRERHVLELNQIQVIKSIQGGIKRAYQDASSLAQRMRFVNLMAYRQDGQEELEKSWMETYQPLVVENLGTAEQFHAIALFSAPGQSRPEFFFQGDTARRNGILESLFHPERRPILEEALQQTSQLKPEEHWCSRPLVLRTIHGEPLPVLIGGFALFNDNRSIGTMLTVIDFRVPLADLVTDLHLSVSISITGEEGTPFFHLDAEQDLANAYVDIPRLPTRLVDLIRSNRMQELYIDELYRDRRQFACVSTAPLIAGQTTPYVGIVLVADYDQLIREPFATRWWVAGIVTAAVVAVMFVTWFVTRAITLLAMGS